MADAGRTDEKFYVAYAAPADGRALVVTAGPPSGGHVRFTMAGAGLVASLPEGQFAADFREMNETEVAGLPLQFRLREGDVYVLKEDVSFPVALSWFRGGMVAFHNVGGGFEKRVEIEQFDREFRLETGAERDARLAYAKGAVRLDSFGPHESIPAWVNGERWNGSVVPTFEAADMHDAIASGLLPYVHHYEDGDFFISVFQQSEPLPNYDKDALLPRLAAMLEDGEHYAEMEIGGVVAEIHIHPGRDVPAADGGTVRTYDVGARNLCWMRHVAPEPSSRPSA